VELFFVVFYCVNPKNSYEFFARRADELQNTVIQYVKHKIQHKPKFKHNPNLGLLHFAFIGVNPDVINGQTIVWRLIYIIIHDFHE